MKKYMALILALAMVIVPLASCADKTDDGGGGGGGEAKSTDAATGGAETQAETESADVFDVPKGFAEGVDFMFLVRLHDKRDRGRRVHEGGGHVQDVGQRVLRRL